jgi:hypothetical protein
MSRTWLQLLDSERALDAKVAELEAALETLTGNRDELIVMVVSLKAALAEQERMLDAAWEWFCEYLGRDWPRTGDQWLADLKARAAGEKPTP